MFYEIKDKRVLNEFSPPPPSSSVKFWLIVAFTVVSLSAIFVAFVHWLGIAGRQNTDTFVSSDLSSDENRPWLKSERQRYRGITPPLVEYSTTFPPQRIGLNVKSKTRRTETTAMTEEAIGRVTAEYGEQQSKIAATGPTSTGENFDSTEDGVVSMPMRTKDKTSPPISPPSPFVLWNAATAASHELPDFSQIEPDLGAFNTKTIPAFTYLKEPLPRFDEFREKDSDDETMYYHEDNANNLAAESEDENFVSLLQKQLRSIQHWLLYGGKSNRNQTIDFIDLGKILKNSLRGQSLIGMFAKLKDAYNDFNSTEVQRTVSDLLYPTNNNKNGLNNSSNMVSFGLLAIDLFLLHNVQQIMWNEESTGAMEMANDPDVLALQALFMSPDRVRQLRQSNSRILNGDDDSTKNGIVNDFTELINGALRAVLNLSRAYKSSTSNSIARSSSASTLDCIWTLYCRNLDKTAKVNGPYGFLAKMNSLGLRLMMGEFPVDKVLDRFTKEYKEGWTSLDCDRLFPRCGVEEAQDVVIQTALGQISK